MNIINLDAMKFLIDNKNCTQKEISEGINYSIGAINKAVLELKEKEIINNENNLTDKGIEIVNKNKTRNAIILAAGFGIRMVPINLNRPKGLLEVNGERLIERLINQLHDANIKNITVVAGFQKEKYEYLIDKFGVNLKIIDTYHEKNNLHSLYAVRDEISNTYILPSDLYFINSPFSEYEFYSWYMISDVKGRGSYIKENRNREIINIGPDQISNKMIGVSYITEKDSKKAINILEEYASTERYNNYFWEDALIRAGFKFYSKMINNDSYFEINTYESLREFDNKSRHLKSSVINLIAEIFRVNKNEIKNIVTLKKGMTNRSFSFTIGEAKFIMRIPGEGTDKMINRKQEAKVYNLIKNKNICDDIIYINPDTGFKITKFIDNSRECDINSDEDIRKCMQFVKKMHKQKLKIDHKFDPFNRIEYYESLWTQENSLYSDYSETKKNIYKLKDFVEENKSEEILCHIDTVQANFLIYTDKNSEEEKVRLIDWEYAGMQDYRFDIANFCIYSLLDKEDSDKVIDLYYDYKTKDIDRYMIYAYMAISGLVWSNWCEIKSQLGVEFGEYSIKQYRYAKDYYRLLKDKGLVK